MSNGTVYMAIDSLPTAFFIMLGNRTWMCRLLKPEKINKLLPDSVPLKFSNEHQAWIVPSDKVSIIDHRTDFSTLKFTEEDSVVIVATDSGKPIAHIFLQR